MRAVPVAVERVGVGVWDAPGRDGVGGVVGVAGEVGAADDLGGWEGARLDDCAIVGGVGGRCPWPAEVGVGIIDPAVDHADADALAGRAVGRAPDRRRADEGHGVGIGALLGRDHMDAGDAGQRAQSLDLPGVDRHRDAVVGQAGLEEHLRAQRRQALLQASLRREDAAAAAGDIRLGWRGQRGRRAKLDHHRQLVVARARI